MIGFDFEVFMYDWLVVFKDLLSGEKTVIVNDKEELQKYYDNNKDELFIGFNNSGYDNFIFKGIMMGLDPYYLSNVIINKTNNIWRVARWIDVDLNSYDVSFNVGFTSLKENEAYLGISIDETPIPFDLDRPLNDDELEQVIEYCKRDVNATELVFHKTISVFETKLYLIRTFNLDRSYMNKSSNNIIDAVLGATRPYRGVNDEYDGFDFTQLDLKIEKYKELLTYFEQEIPRNYKGFNHRMEVAGVPHVFGIGGIHGARPNFEYDGKLMLLDVASYYPSMMIEYDWFSRSIPNDKKKLYAKMLKDRVEIKHTDKLLSDSYKLILNTTYGSYKYKWCNLYDPRMANNITIGGQVMIVDLIEQLEPYMTLVQSNTDGIIIIPKDEDKIIEIKEEWEKRTGMVMEVSYGNRIVQKDVNNYVMRMDNGYIEAVGGQVRMYNYRGLRRTMAVVDKALVEHLMNDISIDDYIMNHDEILDFQIISKVGKTYDKVFLEDISGKQTELNFVNRSFAGYKPARLYKQKEGKNKELVASHPQNTFVWNGDVGDLDINDIDKSWYIEMAYNRLRQYKGE